MKQKDKILYFMLSDPDKKIWTAKDFQSRKYFIGYEASARMSELANSIYKSILIVSKDGRYRTLEINWKKKKEIKKVKKLLEDFYKENG